MIIVTILYANLFFEIIFPTSSSLITTMFSTYSKITVCSITFKFISKCIIFLHYWHLMCIHNIIFPTLLIIRRCPINRTWDLTLWYLSLSPMRNIMIFSSFLNKIALCIVAYTCVFREVHCDIGFNWSSYSYIAQILVKYSKTFKAPCLKLEMSWYRVTTRTMSLIKYLSFRSFYISTTFKI